MENLFNMEQIDKTFVKFAQSEIYDGVVVIKKNEGVIFNIGGKLDSFIDNSEFENFDEVKVGDRFKVVLLQKKNDDGFIMVSKKQADEIIKGSLTAEKLKLGSEFSFYITKIQNDCLYTKLGVFNVVVPKEHIDQTVKNINFYLNKQCNAVVIDIDKENKLITASIKLLKEQIKENAETIFWNSVFINKIVTGTVKKIMPYGAFVDVNGVSAFIHISDLSFKHIESPSEIIEENQKYIFRIIKLDKENNKVQLGLKQTQEDPRVASIKTLNIGDTFNEAEVIKLLPFGAIVKINDYVTALLHISDATENASKRIYEIVKVGDKINVEIKSIDSETNKISVKLS